MRRADPGLYRKDLARIHHEGFGSFARRAAPGILRWLREGGVRSGTVVDLGCGSGLWLAALQRAGYAAVGVDVSAACLRLARSTAPGARLHLATVSAFGLPPCDAVTAMGEVLAYRMPGRSAAASLKRIVGRVSAALPGNGLFIFDLVLAGNGEHLSYELSRNGRGWKLHMKVHEDRRRGILTREITTVRQAGRTARRSVERHVLDLLRREQVEELLRSAGFTVRVSRRYGSFELPPRRLAFRARRRR